jgi:hypothetical protein
MAWFPVAAGSIFAGIFRPLRIGYGGAVNCRVGPLL